MTIFKCKMCGGDLEVKDGASVAECQYCGTKQTLPKLGDDERANLYDRANHFRRNNEYDKAAGIYERILDEDKTDAEAYWSLVLCKYGIEYVEDPTTHKRVPTVNRAQYTSIFADENYKEAIANADSYQKSIYESEAKAIDDIQKGILEISSKEEPFDIFICYKETGSDGRRTPDSVLATELYHELTKEGFKVFFSRITLEDKLGTAYEPYIFAALNSAKVMVVLGTKPEYFNAVWVKNEWSRFLALIKSGEKKTLIPAYKEMDPYDLPEEFSHLQAQDMSKLGFMQDLTRGIQKILSADEPKKAVKETVIMQGNTDTAPLLKRAFMFLEDGEWQNADEYCEKVLDLDPECAEAYLGKLMAQLHVKTSESLKDCELPFDDKNNYTKAYRFGDDALRALLTESIDFINERNKTARLTDLYNRALESMESSEYEEDFKIAASKFDELGDFKDSQSKKSECLEKAEEARKEAIYQSAGSKETHNISDLEEAIEEYTSIQSYKDSVERIELCKNRIEELKIKEEKDRIEKEQREEQERLKRKKSKKIKIIISAVAVVCVVFGILAHTVIIPNSHYNKAVEAYNAENFSSAITEFEAAGDYKDATDKLAESKKANVYQQAQKLMDSEEYDKAYKKFVSIKGYKDVDDLLESDKNLVAVIKKLQKKYKVGKTVKFADIEWLVLDEDGDSRLLITKDCIESDMYYYNYSDSDITWENCTLRSYLNDDWYNSTFSKEEKTQIKTTHLVNADNDNTEGGDDTYDKVFLLSIFQVIKYFEQNNSMEAYYKVGEMGWWLRSPGEYSNYAAYVDTEEGLCTYGGDVSSEFDWHEVRPAIWIDITK